MTEFPLSRAEYPGAEAVRTTLEHFVRELDDELSQSAVEKLLFGTISMSDQNLDLDYKSEDFTLKLLVDELLDAVGLQYRPEPKAPGIERDRWPDLKLSNTVIPVIGEIKPLNDISSGESQIKSYLCIDEFDTPYGILTDGIEWRVYGPDRSGSGYTIRKQVGLDNAFQTVADQTGVIESRGLSSTIRCEGIAQIADFVQTFERNQFDDWTLLGLPKERRDNYTPEGFESQASLNNYL